MILFFEVCVDFVSVDVSISIHFIFITILDVLNNWLSNTSGGHFVYQEQLEVLLYCACHRLSSSFHVVVAKFKAYYCGLS